MKTLRENVIVKTATGHLAGTLLVGKDGLPTLFTYNNSPRALLRGEFFTLATLPATWQICWQRGNATNVLFDTWAWIDKWRRQIADAQREAEQETPEPEDELTAAKRQRALEEG